ncbi:MAG: hypothetical protein Q8Q52_03115 [Acidimicrobiia bacterium]|nr:hypothetical protein [Acidimicrobiia bacterium]
MRLSAVIMAHPARATMVAELQASLDRDIPVVWDEKNDIWDTGRRAMLAAKPGSDYHLVLQDDLLVCRDLLAGLESALEHLPHQTIVSLYMGQQRWMELIDRVLDLWENHPHVWVKSQNARWGPAVCVPSDWTRDLVAFGDTMSKPSYDQRINQWRSKRRHTCYYTWPSLVEHRLSPSLIGHRLERQARRFIGTDASALDVDWSGAVADINHDPEGRAVMATFRNISTGEVIKLKAGDSRFYRLTRLTHRWERLDPDPEPKAVLVEPEPIAPAGIAAHVDMSANVTDILVAVGGDIEVAAVALEAELSAERPRKSLVAALGEIVAGPAEHEAEGDSIEKVGIEVPVGEWGSLGDPDEAA